MQLVPQNNTNTAFAVTRTYKNGATMNRATFTGEVSTKDALQTLRDKGLKGNKLKKAFNELVTGKSTLAWAAFDATVSMARGAGLVPDTFDIRKDKAGKPVRAAASFVAPVTVKDTKAEKEQAMRAALIAFGLTDEQIEVALAAAK